MFDPSNPASVFMYGLAFIAGLVVSVQLAERRLWTGPGGPPRVVRGIALAVIGVVGAVATMLAVIGVSSLLAGPRL